MFLHCTHFKWPEQETWVQWKGKFAIALQASNNHICLQDLCTTHSKENSKEMHRVTGALTQDAVENT